MSYGYGKDLGYIFTSSGLLDLALTSSGDLKVIGGDENDDLETKRQNAWQAVKLRILTPRYSIKDPNDPDSEVLMSYGSLVHTYIGYNVSPEVNMLLRGALILAVMECQYVSEIHHLQLDFDERQGRMAIKLGVRFRGDEEVLFETFALGGA